VTEHRSILDPAILGRLATSMVQFEQAWQADLVELRRTEEKLADAIRSLNSADDRASHLEADLRQIREENKALLLDNAHLKAQVQALYDNSQDAKTALDNLAARAVDAARTVPSEWKDPEKNPPGDNDGTGLPRGQPEFIHSITVDGSSSQILRSPSQARIPVNEFGRREVAGART